MVKYALLEIHVLLVQMFETARLVILVDETEDAALVAAQEWGV